MLKEWARVLREKRHAVASEEGATIIEYVLLAAVIAVGVFAVIQTLRNTIQSKVNSITNTVNSF